MKLRRLFDFKYASVIVPTFFALAIGFWWTALSVRDDIFYELAFGFLTLTLLYFLAAVWSSNLPMFGSRTRIQRFHLMGCTLAFLFSTCAVIGWLGVTDGEWQSWMTIQTHYTNDHIVGWFGKRWIAERRIDIALTGITST